MVWNGRIDETQVKLFHSEFGLASIEQSSDKEQRVDGEFRVLSAVVRLRRNPLKHLKIIMIPGVIFTIVGYLSLFILEDSTLTDIPNLVSFELGLTRLILSAAVFLMFQLNTQIYYIRESVGGVMTGADIWILVVSAIQILLLAYNVTLVIASKRTVLSHSVDVTQLIHLKANLKKKLMLVLFSRKRSRSHACNGLESISFLVFHCVQSFFS